MVTNNPELPEAARVPTRLDKIIATFIALLLFGFYMLTFDGTLHSTDGLAMLAISENLVKHGHLDTRQLENWETTYLSVVGLNLHRFDGVLDTPDEAAIFAAAEVLANETRLDISLLQELGDVYVSADGRPYVVWGIGPTLLMLPWVMLAWVIPHIGLTQTTMTIVPLSAALAGAYLYLSSRRLGYSPRVGLAATLLAGLATMTWTYTRDLTAEPFILLSLTLTFYAALAYRQDQKLSQAALLGLALGLTILHKAVYVVAVPLFLGYTFIPEAIIRPFNFRNWFKRLGGGVSPSAVGGDTPPPSEFLPLLKRSLKESVAALPWLHLLMAAGLCALSLVIIAFYNFLRFEHPLQTGYPFSFTTPFWLGFSGFIISPYKSLFLYGPIFILIPLALRPSWRRHPLEASLILGLLLAHLIFFGAWYDWGGGKSWGPRFLVPMNGLLILLLLPYLERAFRPRQWAYQISLVLVGLISLLVQIISLSGRNDPYLGLSSYWRPTERSLWGELQWQQPDLWPIWGHWLRLDLYRLPVIWHWEWEGIEHFDPLSLSLLLLIMVLGAAGLGLAFSRQGLAFRWGGVAWMIALIGVGTVLWRSYDDPRSIKSGNEALALWPAYRDLMEDLPSLVHSGDAVIFTDRRFEFYLLDLDKSAAQRYIVAKDTQPLILKTVPQLLEVQAGQGRVWLVTDDLDNRGLAYAAELWLEAQGRPVAHHLFGSSVQLTAFELDTPPPWPAIPVEPALDQVVNPDDYRFEGIAALLGWNWPEVDATSPITLKAGESYAFELYWIYGGKAPEDRFFVRLLSAANEPVVELLTGPQGEARLIPGQLMVEAGVMTLPAELAAGSYRLQIGFFIPVVETGELIFDLPEDITQIEVVP